MVAMLCNDEEIIRPYAPSSVEYFRNDSGTGQKVICSSFYR